MVTGLGRGRHGDTWAASRIALAYAGMAALWILVSDRVVEATVPAAWVAAVQSAKGLLFVAATAVAIWALVRRRLRQVRLVEGQRSASEDRLARFAGNLPGTAYIADADGRFVFVRGQTAPGLPPAAEMVGRTAHGWLDAETADRLRANDLDVLRGGGPSQLVEPVPLPDGRRLHYLIHRFPLQGPAGEPLVGGVAFDVTERAVAESRIRDLARELEAANRQKDQFLSNLSHELRTPVTAIRLWIDVLKGAAGPDDLESVREAAGMIENSAISQTQLIDDLLDVTRIITGKLTLERTPLDLAGVVRQTVALLGPMADEREVGVDLAVDVGDTAGDGGALTAGAVAAGAGTAGGTAAGVAAVVGDARRVQQVVWNLVNNAVKFSHARGRVRVALTRDGAAGDHWALAVSDEGVGIDADLLPRLFERFRQADASRVRAEGGLGIGLSLVKHMVEAHGGDVSAASAGLGKGATFVARFPVAHGEAAAAAAAAAAAVAARGGRGFAGRLSHAGGPPTAVVVAVPPAAAAAPPLAGRRVLLVEDNADSRTGMALLLGRAGAAVKSADDVDSALSAGDDFDVLVSDIGLPDRDGCELIAELRKRPAWRGRPALAVSAYALPEDRRRALAAGFDEFVVKPVDPDALIATVAGRLRAVGAGGGATTPG